MRYAFLMIKNHAVRDRSVGAILRDIETAGFRIRAMRMLDTTGRHRACMHDLYYEHKGKPYYDRLIDSVTGRVVACALEHIMEDGIDCVRALAGATDPKHADPRTLRHRYGGQLPDNAVHTSDSIKNMIYEASIFFSPEELPSDWPDIVE